MPVIHPIPIHAAEASSISTIRAWWDVKSEYPNSVNSDGMPTLAILTDKSGNGYNTNATVKVQQPLWVNFGDRGKAMRFDGVDDGLSLGSANIVGGLGALTFMSVGSFPASTALWGLRSSAGTTRLAISSNANRALAVSGKKSNDTSDMTSAASSDGAVPDNTPCVVIVTLSFAAARINAWINGDKVINDHNTGTSMGAGFNSTAPNGSSFFGRAATSATFYDFDLAAAAIWSAVLTDTEVQRVNALMRSRFGI